jgi:DNA-binding MarR family transcriptional regulator
MARRDDRVRVLDGAEVVTAWRDLASCYSSVRCALDRELADRHGLGMSEFEVLDRLAETSRGGQLMLELGEAMYLSQSALSRVVARLEREGLVVRAMCAEDRRCVSVELTAAGVARHAEARPTQLAVLSRLLGARPEPRDAKAEPRGAKPESGSAPATRRGAGAMRRESARIGGAGT